MVAFTITPSAFHNDPLGHVLNQSGHAWLLGAPAGLLLWFVPWWLGLIVASGLYWCFIELPQIRSGGRKVIGDSIEDALHFAFGVLMAYTFALWAFVAWLCILALGAYFRT